MVVTRSRKESNAYGGSIDYECVVLALEVVNTNGIERRKNAKITEPGKISDGPVSQPIEKFLTQESDMHTKTELTEACAVNEAHTCTHCKEKVDKRNFLVCDSCEEIYHISCIELAVEEIPTRSWFCANCTAKGLGSSHENFTAHESSKNLAANEGGKGYRQCKVCRTEVCSEDEYRICGYSFCPHKLYHLRCLTMEKLISNGSCWYCPSCLCRACLTDQDDDKIVLCDGCDHAYHIYCMQPPRSAIPRGKWFCQKCENRIQSTRRARRSDENNLQNTSKKRALDGQLKDKEALDKLGGVDMLLNAAKTLDYEENPAEMGLDTDSNLKLLSDVCSIDAQHDHD